LTIEEEDNAHSSALDDKQKRKKEGCFGDGIVDEGVCTVLVCALGS
jgi:hypothetical protein